MAASRARIAAASRRLDGVCGAWRRRRRRRRVEVPLPPPSCARLTRELGGQLHPVVQHARLSLCTSRRCSAHRPPRCRCAHRCHRGAAAAACRRQQRQRRGAAAGGAAGGGDGACGGSSPCADHGRHPPCRRVPGGELWGVGGWDLGVVEPVHMIGQQLQIEEGEATRVSSGMHSTAECW